MLIDVKLRVKEAMRQMLLPIPSNKEDECVDAIIKTLSAQNIDEDSYDQYLNLKFDIWKSDNQIDKTLKKVITECLKLSNSEYGHVFAESYFTIHSALIASNPFINFELSIILLSHLQLIANLADREQMSAAKITKVLASIDNRLEAVSWRDLQPILRKIKLLPQLEDTLVANLYKQDEILQEEYFADADIVDASFQVGEKAKSLQFPFDAESILSTLSGSKVHIPYLQILHYQCVISGFYDHVFSTPYEFSPRGLTANALFAKWHGLLHTSNPILNNAKAVDVLNDNWARSRNSAELEQALMLTKMLKGLDGMGFAAAQELTKWIRMWLVRYIGVNTTKIIPIKSNPSLKEIQKILNSIKKSPTQTFGILEQRFVDVLASSIYSADVDWRPRGLGDSVNSNNLAKRKLGDCDFQNSRIKKIVAYEAHGGVLSKIYYEGHVRTFSRSLIQRLEELEKIADISSWDISVVFVAYGFEKGLPKSFNHDKIKVNVDYKTFDELSNTVDTTSKEFSENFDKFFVTTVNDRKTPKMVRNLIHKLLK